MKMKKVKRGNIVASAVLVTLLTTASITGTAFAAETFSDVESHWARDTIEKWQGYNIINGVGDNKYMPDSNIQRKDFAVIVCKLIGLSGESDSNITFSDLKEDEYYTSSIKLLASVGIITGKDGQIKPSELVTRQEAASILCKALNIPKSNQEIKGEDADTIDEWARPYISALTNAGYMRGDTQGNINPKANVTRAEALVLISNIVGEYNTDGLIVGQNETDITSINNTVKIEDTIVSGKANIILNDKLDIISSTINELSTSSDIVNINKSKVTTVIANKSNIVINTDGSVNTLIINSNNVVVNNSGAINKLVINPGNSVIYNGNKLENTSAVEVTYSKETLGVKESNKASLIAQLKHDNSLTANIKTDLNGTSGILYNNSLNVPTLEKHDGEVQQLNTKLKDNSEITVRGYIIDNNKVEYTNVIALRSFDHKLGMKIKSTEAIRDNGKLLGIKKTAQFSLKGTNIPEINSIQMLSSTDNILDINSHESVVDRNIMESTIQFNVNEYGTVALDRFYGYRITFKDGSTYEAFPILEDSAIPENYISDINTGEAEFIGNKLEVKGNTYKSAGSLIEETGIVYKVQNYSETEPEVVGNDWEYVKSTSMDNSVSIDMKDTTNSKIYYTFYVRTNTGKSYGPIKQIVGRTAPILTGNQSININKDSNIASIKIGIDTSSNINLNNSIIHSLSKDNKTIEKYSEIKLDTIDSKYTDGILQIVLTGLEKGIDYKLSLLVSNDSGILDNITIQFSTK